MGLRRLYFVDAWLMLIVGFAFWGYGNASVASRLFGIDYPTDFSVQHMSDWRAISFTGTFGGALMAFGFATLAIATIADERFHWRAAGYFVTAHFFLGFVVFAKETALWDTKAGFLLVDITAFPGAGYLYFLFSNFARNGRHAGTPQEHRIRELARQEERNRLGQDLHDSVKQQIYSIQTNLAAAETRWATDFTGAQEAVQQSRALARDAMAEMTALLDRLRHDPVESVGLAEALRRQCEALRYQTGTEVTMDIGKLPGAGFVQPEAMTAIFRIAQEALANAGRHARPKHVRVKIGIEENSNTFALVVTDDGMGFDSESTRYGMGLANIKERACELDAALTIESRPGEGCTIVLELPLSKRSAQDSAQHQLGLIAMTICLVPMSVVALGFRGWISYLWPLGTICLAVAFFHIYMLAKIQWASAKS